MTTAARLRVIRAVTLLLLLARESVSIFFNKTSSIETKPLDITKRFTLSFRTCEGGSLLRQIGNNGYFELAVLPGVVDYGTSQFTESSLALRWRTAGSLNLTLLNVGNKSDQNIPYRVVFTPRTASLNATLSVSLGSEVYVVGVPHTIYSVVGKNLTLGQGFIGCITFGDEFDVVNATKQVGTSKDCPLDGGERCNRKACPDGYKGYYCEINIDDCASSPCHHASRCLDGIANYTCQCGPAWSGRNCDELKNETLCDVNPCLHDGICSLVSNFNNYTCTCRVPYTGRNCNETLNPCGSMPCQNNAACTNLRDTDFYCKCPKGFTGKRCENNIDDCARVDCGHGRCVDGISTHACNCTGSGYTGPDCKQDINECMHTGTCLNNATCSNYAGGFLCTCVGDYRGTNCAEKIDDCASNPCKNGGNCTDLAKDFSCHCGPGYSGKTCETKLHDCKVIGCTACHVAPCNHGNCSCNCTTKTMYYNCSCNEGYTGVNCDQDINECMNGSIPSNICGDNGTCRNTNGSFRCECSEGFTGKLCNETEGTCNPNPCANGLCHRINITVNSSLDSGSSSNIMETYNCSCYPGWRGVNCTEDIDECKENIDSCNKTISTCMNTIGNYKCQCDLGYEVEGKQCKDVNECDSSPCANSGICKNIDGDYNCLCHNGFTGKNCLKNIDDCLVNKGHQLCQHGRCVDGIVAFTCVCDVGWKEKFCDVDIDECLLDYCKNNATCNNTDGNYTCACQAGYTGRNCSTDIDDCADSPCNNGKCKDKINDFDCDCFPGYEGKSCEIDIDWCSPTRNGGSVPCDYGICRDGLLNYTCRCFDGFSGQNCSIDKDECTSVPCENSGICVQKSNATGLKMYFGADRVYPKNESGGYLCVCQAGYNGSNCENDIDECALYQPCNKTGEESCKDGINNYTCICNPGFTGRNCSEDIDECSPSPCKNNGTCRNLIAEYKCICDSNHTGVNCEKLVDPCTALFPCRNGATCYPVSDFNYTCACAEGYAGRLCTDRTTLGFDGTFSMTVSVPQTSNNISFSFQTNSREGVLVSQSRFWALSLVSDKLELVCAVGSSRCDVGGPGMFTNSNWRKVEVLFDGSSVSANVSKTICNVSCGTSRRRRAASSELVVGADAGDTGQPKFVGSIRDFSVNNAKYYPGVAGVATEGSFSLGYQRQNVCSPDPCVNGMCKDLWTRYSCECDRYWTSINCTQSVLWGTFGVINQLNNGYRPTSNKSYASYSLSTTLQHLAFTVRTRSASSSIIQLKFNSSMFVSVETDNNGVLRLRDNNGYINSQQSGGLKINNAIPHYIQINRTTITIGNATYDVMLTSLPVRTVFVGGDEEVSAQAQFRGCIRDVRLNGQQLLFFNQTADGLNSTEKNIAEGCSGEDVCANTSGTTTCSGRGNCTDLWNDFQCACQFPYGGDTCELYGCEWTNPCPGNGTCVNLRDTSEYECISEVTFNESQSSAYFTNSSPLSDMNSVVAQFRTRQNNTVILSSVNNATTYFEITVSDGYAKVRYNLTENVTGLVNTDTFVSDGRWHELKIESTASQTNFEISTMELRQDKFTYLNNHSVSRNLSLLNQSFVNLLSMAGVHIGSSPINTTRGHLLGCLREVRLGKQLLTFGVGNATVDSGPEFSLAKSAFMSADLTNVRIGCHRNIVCTGSLCGNGTCVDVWNDFHCACPDGYHGDRCEFNPCTSSPCMGGTCAVRGSGFECACEKEYAGTFCNETCTQDFCKNGGKCAISGGKLMCTCESDWTGRLCEATIPRDDDDDDDDLPLIIGVSVAGGVLLLLVVAVIFVCTRQTSSTFGIYSPSGEEKAGARVEMNPVLNVPPPEKLI